MYEKSMSKLNWPPRMSLPLTTEERHFIIDLKAILEKREMTLKDFVWNAILERVKREHLPMAEQGQKK